MSGDSPNNFTNENVFDFRDGRSSPAPTTSKEATTVAAGGGGGAGGGVVQASVLVEPPTNKDKAKEEHGKDGGDDDADKPDFCSPTYNNPKKDGADAEKTDKDNKRDKDGGGGGGGKDGGGGGKDEKCPLNGEVGKEGDYNSSAKNFEDEEDDTCLVNCIYYTMECCKCTIM